ncbi:MAG: TSUP family transporter [Gemmatimonadota bacterium]|nr:TSUP family transporter [Gemmatimonadota bacterium]
MAVTTLVIATIIVTIGATLQGSVGFGLGMFSVPLLLLVAPVLIPGPLICSSMALTLLLTHREWHAVRLADIKWALAGRLVGVAVAVTVLAIMPTDGLGLLLGALVLVAVGVSVSGVRLSVSPRTLLGAGTLSGFMGTVVSIGGPPVALLYQHESGPRIRGTLSAYFVLGVSMSLVGLHFVGRFGLTEFLLALELLPGILVGFLLSRRIAGALDRGRTRSAVLMVSALSGVGVLIKQLL